MPCTRLTIELESGGERCTTKQTATRSAAAVVLAYWESIGTFRAYLTLTAAVQAWVTCVEHLPDGRVLSGGMDSKLCLWGRKSTRCRDLLGHTKSISALNVGGNGTRLRRL